jgi:hypothetical protein
MIVMQKLKYLLILFFSVQFSGMYFLSAQSVEANSMNGGSPNEFILKLRASSTYPANSNATPIRITLKIPIGDVSSTPLTSSFSGNNPLGLNNIDFQGGPLGGFYYISWVASVADYDLSTLSTSASNFFLVTIPQANLTNAQIADENDPSTGTGSKIMLGDPGVNQLTNVLPVKLSSFTAEKAGNRDALLNWSSIQEINSSHFMVQRSDNAKDFHDLAMIEAAGNSNRQIDYEYVDRNINIQRNTSKLVYYRLKQVDIDGFTEFSDIRAVRFDRIGLADVSIYPNPTADVLHLDISDDLLDDQVNYEIFDVQGKMVVSQQINIEHQKLHLLNLRESGLQSGIYFIKLRNKKELLTSHKFVLISQ